MASRPRQQCSFAGLSRFAIVSILVLVPILVGLAEKDDGSNASCSAATARIIPFSGPNESTYRQQGLHLMEYDIGDSLQTAWVYIEPPVSSFYRHLNASASCLNKQSARSPSFTGRQCKFFNLLRKPVDLYWGRTVNGDEASVFIRTVRPFSVAGVSAFVGDTFTAMTRGSDALVIGRYSVSSNSSNLFPVDQQALLEEDGDSLSRKQYPSSRPSSIVKREEESHQWLEQTLAFSEPYFQITKRPFLSRYGRNRPHHWMWPAEYFGQQHTVLTKYGDSSSNHHPTNLTLTAISCAPRVFEIQEFLSQAEATHLIELAYRREFKASQTGGVISSDNTDKAPKSPPSLVPSSVADQQEQTKEDASSSATAGTRTSQNVWIWRQESTIVDTIYRRAADLLGIPQDDFGSNNGRHVAEPLQLVQYDVGEEYKAHYDFGYPDPTHPDQPTRFATLLLYLNDPSSGGETSFPRWTNGEPTDEPLLVTPQVGKAILFYLQTPDGNMDDLSIHAALPVLKGEKVIANLWIWDPFVDIESLN